ncbi:Crp/Fnr family transcriptional regulator [Aliiroseovarius sp. PrR006]|uniref:Crp/Fnr family transcriptional regulator n=1 Tax=Aliiroseovarius sp. PrR006 TaxID=2706883 RepID=UPI0013D8478A|nr:Crp/Fnr family transcriptional regulator [Aliiroseovarius sp. PrR006]NDW54293.1 Crp/Fnr family transcriptional regulator [Aliiroseovarius sp. PrR006]
MSDLIPLPAPFDGLPLSDLPRRSLTCGEHLFHQGDRARGMFFVEQGEVRLVRHTEAGQLVTMFRAGSGDTLAEPSLFSDHYHCDAIADRDSTVRVLDKAIVLGAMTENTTFAIGLVQRLSAQVQSYRRKQELLAIRSARDRVLAGLADGWMTGTVVAFASDLGLSHEVVFRVLSDLVRDGQVERPARGVYRLKRTNQAAS